jgi:hypothetical protein
VVTIVNPATPERAKKGSANVVSGLTFFGEAVNAELTGEIEVDFTGLEDNVYVSTIS